MADACVGVFIVSDVAFIGAVQKLQSLTLKVVTGRKLYLNNGTW